MPVAWKPNEFKIGINMAGAVSAGAYTAGVLDFLVEALEEWDAAKSSFRKHLANPAPAGIYRSPVPLHDVSIEVFSGASAGGMCAAIASAMVQGTFQHVTTPGAVSTNNTFYEAWVNEIDISELLKTNDLKKGAPLVSLLDSTTIDNIAEAALTPAPPVSRSYISSRLTLFLTLTNVRGVPYQLYDDPSPTVNEFITYYGDRLQFEVTGPNCQTSAGVAKPLPSGLPQKGAWPLLREAAKATGAFPLFLAPRELSRDLSDYAKPNWLPLSAPQPSPSIKSDLPGPPASTTVTLNVDGGVTDNDPFQLAHDFLASQNPKATNGSNPPEPLSANCAVISVAPFPSEDRYDPQYSFSKAQGIFGMLGRIFTVLLSQSRFLGESLSALTSGAAFSRFVIAPSDPTRKNQNALQCASLSAFGGFMDRSFRAHDFLLGRYNCQMFLKTHFRLPVGNAVIDAGQAQASSYAPGITARFASGPPPGVNIPPQDYVWLPIIPLVGNASAPIVKPERGAITKDRIQSIADLILKRLNAIKEPLLAGAPAAWLLKLFIGVVCTWPVRMLVRNKLINKLVAAFGSDVKGLKGAAES